MAKTTYVWDELSDNVIEEYEDGVLSVSYDHEPGLYGNLLSENRNGVTSYYNYDGRGDTVALTDDSGNVTDTKEYDAWGNVIASTGSTVTPYQFVGRQGYQTDKTGVYVRARIYQPTAGRWICSAGSFNQRTKKLVVEIKFGQMNDYVWLRSEGIQSSFVQHLSKRKRDTEITWLSIEKRAMDSSVFAFMPVIDGGLIDRVVNIGSFCADAACRTCANAAGVNALAEINQLELDGADDKMGGNPMRHCLAACLTVKLCGITCARYFWDGREEGNNNAGRQDLMNNRVGYGNGSGSCCACDCFSDWDLGKFTCQDPITKELVPCPPYRGNRNQSPPRSKGFVPDAD